VSLCRSATPLIRPKYVLDEKRDVVGGVDGLLSSSHGGGQQQHWPPGLDRLRLKRFPQLLATHMDTTITPVTMATST